MKKFLVFCVAIIVTVSLGFMVYYFTLNNEGVTMPETVYQLNVGEVRAFELIHENPKDDTEISFAYENEGIVEFDLESMSVKALSEGTTRVTLVTTNKDIPLTYIDVYVGGGSTENPFFIRNQAELSRIGDAEDVFKLSSNYLLVNDITLNLEWEPIASTDAFTGTFNGNNMSISNLSITNQNLAGLFGKIGATGVVSNLNVKNVTITGNSTHAGGITAINNGTIRNSSVTTASITSSNESAYLGGIAGLNESTTTIASIYKCTTNSAITGSGVSKIGGITGSNNGAEVVYCYTNLDTVITPASYTYAGGLVGYNTYSSNYASIVAGSYVLGDVVESNFERHGAVVGYQDYNANTTTEKSNKIYGNYYVSTCANKGIGGAYADEVNGSSDPLNIDYGIYGVEGKTYDELCQKTTFILLRDGQTDELVKWDFADVWTMEASGTPKLNVNGSFVSSGRTQLVDADKIEDADDLIALIQSGSVVEITNDIDLGGVTWNPLEVTNVTIFGSEEFYAENGRYPKIYNFKLANGENVGFFKELNNSTIKNIRFEDVSNISDDFETSAVSMGAIAGSINETSIVENVVVSFDSLIVNVSSNLNASEIYIGAVSGKNYGTINGVTVADGTITITFDAEVKATTYVGGVTGALMADSNAVQNSVVKAINLNVANGNNGATGGIVGLMTNSTKVENSYIENSYISTSINYVEKSNDSLIGHYEGAIAGQANQGAKGSVISGSTANNVTITGFVVGGVIGSTTGTVESCYVNVDLTGFKVGGVAGYQINSSRINNVRVDGILENSNITFGLGQVHSSKAQKAGVACISYGNQNEIPKFENVFVNCKFENDGRDSYKTTATIKDNSFMNRLGIKWIFSGEEKNIVINKDKCGNAKTNEKAGTLIDAIGNLISSTTFSIYETDEASMNKGDFKVFTSHGYTIDNWTFVEGEPPAIKNCKNSSVQN
ncbi:MAG: hypothetical protein IJZ29_05930 [Clostridia bacterium]|nr:hypothetical protein [Clostridia bacterium]